MPLTLRKYAASALAWLGLQDALDAADQGDQVVHRQVALQFARQLCVFTLPLQFVDDCVLGLFLPVKQEDLVEEWR
jgi:hypothetical protein